MLRMLATLCEVNKAHLEEFEAAGVAIVENVLTPAECSEAIRVACLLSAPQGGSYKPVMQPHRENELFRRLLSHPNLLKLAEAFVHGEPAGLQTEMFFCKPGTWGFAPHQDNYFVRSEPRAFVSAWIPLVDVTPEMGGLYVYRGSHRHGLLPVRNTNLPETDDQDVNGYSRAAVLPKEFVGREQHLSAPAGSAIMLHGDLVHGSNDNVSSNFRYVLLCTYIRAGTTFNPGQHAKRCEIKFERRG